ncbi:MAG TPA: hypothetical protein VMZ04_07980 [Anaerolineae bacterium]|nr:hypothetical protein [Anaerolineae bacterium]
MRSGMVVLVLFATYFFIDISSAENNTGEVSFVRNDRILTWKTINAGHFNLNENIDLRVENTLSTTLNIPTGKKDDRWYHTVYNSAKLGYRLSDKVDLGFTAREDWNKDTMSTLGETLLTTDYDSNIQYRPFKNFVMDAEIGHIFDKRFDNKDRGTQLRGEIHYFGEPLKNISLNLTGRGITSNLQRSREGYQNEGRISFNHDSMNISLFLSDDLDQRGYFSDIDRKKIEKRERHEQKMSVSLSRGDFTKTVESAAFEVTMNLEKKLISDTANDNPQSYKYKNNTKSGMKGFSIKIGKGIVKRISTEWEMEYSKNPNGVERLSRRRTQTDIATRGLIAFGLSHTDTVEVTGWIKRTRIDTPVSVTNDRDELKVESGLLYGHQFTDNLKTTLDFRVLESHYVNMDISQSSQNKWMKTYMFSPSLIYQPLEILTVNHALNLYANYISYDFDNDFAPRSNISRRVTSETWAVLKASQKTIIHVGAMFEENDYGKLNSKGDKMPAEDGIRRSGNVSIEYIFTDWLSLNPYYVYAIRHDWLIVGDMKRPLRREVDQTYGLDCRLFKKENGNLAMNVKRIVRETGKYPLRIRNYITMTLNYEF